MTWKDDCKHCPYKDCVRSCHVLYDDEEDDEEEVEEDVEEEEEIS